MHEIIKFMGTNLLSLPEQAPKGTQAMFAYVPKNYQFGGLTASGGIFIFLQRELLEEGANRNIPLPESLRPSALLMNKLNESWNIGVCAYEAEENERIWASKVASDLREYVKAVQDAKALEGMLVHCF